MSAIAELTKPLPEVEPVEPATPTLKDEGLGETFELELLQLMVRDPEYRDKLVKSGEFNPKLFLEGHRLVAEYLKDLAIKYPGSLPSAIHFHEETKTKRGGPKDEAEATLIWSRFVPATATVPSYPDEFLKEKIGEYLTSVRLESTHAETQKILRTKGPDEAEAYLKKVQSRIFASKDVGIFDEGSDATHMFRRFKDVALTPIKYFFDKSLPQGVLAMILSPGGIGKSTLLEQLCLCVAGGICQFLPGIFDLEAFGAVLNMNAEDDDNHFNARALECVDHHYPDDPFAEEPKTIHGLTKDEFLRNLHSNLHVITETTLATAKSPLILYDADDHKSGFKAQKNYEAFVAKCLRIPNLKLIVIDPLNQFFAGDENSADDMGAFMMLMKHLAHQTGAVVLVSHHTNKWSQSGVGGDRAASSKLSPDASRGSSAAVNAARWVLQLANCNTQEMAKELVDGVCDPKSFVVGRVVKNNYGPPADEFHLERKGLVLVPADFTKAMRVKEEEDAAAGKAEYEMRKSQVRVFLKENPEISGSDFKAFLSEKFDIGTGKAKALSVRLKADGVIEETRKSNLRFISLKKMPVAEEATA